MHYPEKSIGISANNQLVSYIDEGPVNSPAIIFIHGFPLSKEMWNEQIGVLSDYFRVIAYDIRGHGNSEPGENKFSIRLFVNDLIGLMDALKIDKTILCGFSMGGYVALNAIENYSGRFSALILCDTNCTEDKPEAKEKRMKTIENIKENGLEQYAGESLKKLFAPGSFSKHKEKVAIVSEMILRTSKQSLFKTLFALAERSETCSKLTLIDVPVLILVGKDDEITPPDVAMSMHKKIKSSTIQIIDSAGHLSNMENPDQFNKYLKDFCQQCID